MDEEYSNYYDPEKKRSPMLKIVIIVLILLIAIIIIALFTKAFKKGPDLHPTLSDMAHKYIDDDKLPKEVGECNTYALKDMIANQDNKVKKEFARCNDQETYVKVCKMSNDNYQYTPVLSCKKQKTKFGDWQTGTIGDVIANNSDVVVSFDGEVLENGDRTYYPNDLTDLSKVSEYYVSVPKEGYVYKVNAQEAYKWYVEGEEKEYYNHGEYMATAPDLYPTKEDEKVNTYLTISRPNSAPYRTIDNTILYATEYVAYPYKFECKDPKYQGTITSNTLCERRNTGTFGVTVKMHYTCDGKNETSEGTLCKERSNWVTSSCKNSNQTINGTTSDGYSYTRNLWNGLTCVETSGYQVNETVYKWYRFVKVNKYYPSNSTKELDEKTYYVSTPTPGASKDETTKATAYQYFKLVPNNSSTPMWVSIGDADMNKENLIKSFNELGYKVNSFKEIEENKNTRYQIVIKYRNRK